MKKAKVDFKAIVQNRGCIEIWMPDYLSYSRGKIAGKGSYAHTGNDTLARYQDHGFVHLETHKASYSTHHRMRLPADYIVEQTAESYCTDIKVMRLTPDGRKELRFWLKAFEPNMQGEACRRFTIWDTTTNDYKRIKRNIEGEFTIEDAGVRIVQVPVSRYKGMELDEYGTVLHARRFTEVFCAAAFPGVFKGGVHESWDKGREWGQALALTREQFIPLMDAYMEAVESDYVSGKRDDLFEEYGNELFVWRRWMDAALSGLPDMRKLFHKGYGSQEHLCESQPYFTSKRWANDADIYKSAIP